MRKRFDKIAAGLADAIAYADGDKARAVGGPDVNAIRAKTRLSQVAFAGQLHIPAGAIRDWELGRRAPDAPARTLLGMVDADPAGALALIAKVKTAA